MVKRFLALVISLSVVFALSSCTNGESDVPTTEAGTQLAETTAMRETVPETETTEQETTQPQTQPQTESQEPVQTEPEETVEQENENIGPLFKRYVADVVADGTYTMKFKQLGVRLITTFDGNNSVIESNASGILQITLISKDGRYFMLIPTTKKYVEMSAQEYAEQAESLNSISVSFDGIKLIESGEETILGTRYSTETYDEGERGVVTYYFTDEGLKRLKSVKDGKTNNVETFEVLPDADASVFEIPENYTQVDDPGQVMLP